MNEILEILKSYLSDALDTIADAKVYNDPTKYITKEYRPNNCADLVDAGRHL